MSRAPFTAFNFVVIIDTGSGALCKGTFSEADGLEMNMEPKTIREGGNNGQAIHLMGPIKYGTLTLKRGMTTDAGLWTWFETMQSQGLQGKRGTGQVAIISSDHQSADAVFDLTGCLPIKLKAPALNAKDGAIAIEELQIAYETLSRTE